MILNEPIPKSKYEQIRFCFCWTGPHFQPPPSFVDAGIPFQGSETRLFLERIKTNAVGPKKFRDLKNAAKKAGKNGWNI